MAAFINFLDRITLVIGSLIRWLALVMVLVTVSVVVLRYVFEVGAIAAQESVMYMHGILFLLGISYGIQKNTHVRVDLIYSRLSADNQRHVDLAGHVLFLIPVAVLILYTSLPYAASSWRVWEGSSEVGGIPGVFLLKTLLPVAACLMLTQAVVQIARLTMLRD